MSTVVRDDIFVHFVFEPDRDPERLLAQVYYGMGWDILDIFKNDEEEFDTVVFLNHLRNYAPAWMETDKPDELFRYVIKRLTKPSLGEDVASKNEDVRLVRVAFHQIEVKKQALKDAFKMTYYNLIDGIVERLQTKQRQQELPLSIMQASRTGYFREVGEGGVNMSNNIQLWIKPLRIWFIDEPKEVEWSVDLGDEDFLSGRRTLEGPEA